MLLLGALLASAGAAETPDLSHLGLSPSAERMLVDNGFVVVAGEALDFPEAYTGIRERNVPAFITTDTAFYITDLFLDYVFIATVEDYLHYRLQQLSREMVRLSQEQYLYSTDPGIREAARRNVAYFGVGLHLLDSDYYPPEIASSLMTRELALIEDADGVYVSPIMGRVPLDGVAGPGEDYTQYVPRGHLKENDLLQRFYRAYTWYSRMAFAIPEGRVENLTPTRQALLVVEALESEAGDWLELWHRIADPMRFFVSGAGDPTPVDYMATAHEIYGTGFTVDDLADDKRVIEFAMAVAEYAQMHFETHQVRGMRFMSPWQFPDRQWFVRLPPTSAPQTALDVMSLMRSRAARTVLEEKGRFDDTAYQRNYWEIERWFESLTYGDWTRDLYWSWSYAISAMIGGSPKGVPPLMDSYAWNLRALSTGAAAWSIERFPAGRVRGTEPSPSPPPPLDTSMRPYVEPYPDLYQRLRELLENLRDQLWENYLLDDAMFATFNEYCIFLTSLERISRSALAGEDVRPATGKLGSHARTLARFAATTVEESTGTTGAVPSVAFSGVVYRDITTQKILQVGIGGPDIIYVLMETPDGPAVYGGAIFAFYEYQWDDIRSSIGSDDWTALLYPWRLDVITTATTDKWSLLLEGGLPRRPEWVWTFAAE